MPKWIAPPLKKVLAIIFAFDKFLLHLIGLFTIVYSDHVTAKYLMSKENVNPRSI